MTYKGKTGFSEMFIYNNAVASVINVADAYHFINGLFALDHTENFTFKAGSEGAITAFADAGGGLIRVSAAAHGMAVGDQVSIEGTTNYDGEYMVQAVDTNTFDILFTWISDDGASFWTSPDCLIAGGGVAGDYSFSFTTSFSAASPNQIYRFELVKNTVHIDESACERKVSVASDLGSMSASGVFPVDSGDRIAIQVKNSTPGTANLTLKHANISVHKVG